LGKHQCSFGNVTLPKDKRPMTFFAERSLMVKDLQLDPIILS
jgi:hypothetical protein